MVKNNSNLTPEKQLLKLIEEPYAPTASKGMMRGKGFSLFSPGALQGRWIFLRDRLNSLQRSWTGPLDIRKINAILAFLTLLVGVYFIASSVFLAMKLTALPSFSFKSESAAKIEILKQASSLKALSFYADKIHTRDIFKIGPKEPEEKPSAGGAAQASAESKLAKYKLVGISWSDSPDAMIEDTEAKKTYFLKRNQVIDGVRVQAVFKDKVVLRYGNAEVELR
jgi:hypothetical protein